REHRREAKEPIYMRGNGIEAAARRQVSRPSTNEAPPRRAWCRLANSVVRDERLTAAGLVALAYRATFVGNYALNVTSLLARPIVRGPGFGRNVIERAIANIWAIDYLKRWQPPSKGDRSFAHCVERLTLPPCGATGKAGRIVCQKWFNAKLLT